MKPLWSVLPFSRYDKFIEIVGPDQLWLRLDYDDVNQQKVDEGLTRMLVVLNRYWEPE